MKIRLPLIWRDNEKLDEEELTQYNALGQTPKEIIERSFAVIELNQIESWFPLEFTTIINLKSGKRFEIDIPEELFTGLYSKMALEIIGEVEIKMGDEEEEDEDD